MTSLSWRALFALPPTPFVPAPLPEGHCSVCGHVADTDATTPVMTPHGWVPSFLICCFCGGLRDVIEQEEAS